MQADWQRARARARQPYLRKLEVPAATPCQTCTHHRSSHSMLVLTYRCRVPGCDCRYFEPVCGCGHLLCEHTWGSSETPWACCRCKCLQFGAVQQLLSTEELTGL